MQRPRVARPSKGNHQQAHRQLKRGQRLPSEAPRHLHCPPAARAPQTPTHPHPTLCAQAP